MRTLLISAAAIVLALGISGCAGGGETKPSDDGAKKACSCPAGCGCSHCAGGGSCACGH